MIAGKGTRAVHSSAPNEKEWLTILAAINAAGKTIPNFYIFKGMRRTRDYIALCEDKAIMTMQKKGWMNAHLFNKWMDHFLATIQEQRDLSST